MRGRSLELPARECALAHADAWYVAGELQGGKSVDPEVIRLCVLQMERASRALRSLLKSPSAGRSMTDQVQSAPTPPAGTGH